MAKYQIVRWSEWHGIGFLRPKRSAMILIYDWFLYLGWWEIRKWRYPAITQKEIDIFYSEKKKRGFKREQEESMIIPSTLKPENVKRLMEIQNRLYILNLIDHWSREERKEYVDLTAEREKIRRGE